MYHTEAEYDLLDKSQKSELQDWRAGEQGKDESATRKDAPPKSAKKYDTKKAITFSVEKKVAEKMKAMEQDKIKKDVDDAFIMLLIQKVATGKAEKASASIVSAAVAPAPYLPSLKSILSRVQATKIGP